MKENRLSLWANPLLSPHQRRRNGPSDIEHDQCNQENGSQSKREDESDGRLPEFQCREETTNIELFYDLFFVANLTTFNEVHEINSSSALTSYVGFFCVLWFTWCQVSLFDVRFVVDSVLERMARACHLGVMVGLAVIGPSFNTTQEDPSTFRAMCKSPQRRRVWADYG